MPYISDMDADSPLSTDPISQGDDQLRSIKLDVQSSFPGVDAPVPATAADLNAATEAQTARELANPPVTPTLTGHQTGYAPRYGLIEGGAGDQTGALQDALDSGYAVTLPNGIINFGGTLELPNDTTIFGQGAATVLTYTGAGVAMTTANPGVRGYAWSLNNFYLTNAGTGTLGIDLLNMSNCSLINVRANSFDTNFRVSGTTNGWAVYNRFYNCTSAVGANYGFLVDGDGSNATKFVSCRVAGGGVGVRFMRSNGCSFVEGEIEACTGDGFQLDDSAGYQFSVGHVIRGNRFEGNVGAPINIMDFGVGRARILDNLFYGGQPDIIDGGNLTELRGIVQSVDNDSVGNKYQSAIGGQAAPSWLFDREANSVAGNYPAMRVYDSNSGVGDPVTFQVQSERFSDTSRAVEVLHATANGGGATFGVRGDGRLYTNQVSDDGALGRVGFLGIYDPVTGVKIGRIEVLSG
jgi:hypothetical protein